MSTIKKYPLPVYDPPASYRDFNGGINTSLSNESLQPNELRDGLNCHYSNEALINRPGASLLKTLEGLPLGKAQGDFLYATENNSWIISVRNGRIYYGDFESGDSVNMGLLKINIKRTESILDTKNYVANLQTSMELHDGETEGYIYKYPKYSGIGESTSEEVEPDVDIEYEETLIIQNTKQVQGIPIDDYFVMATGTRLLKIYEYLDPIRNTYSLVGEILEALMPNSWEFANIGPNYLSPFPQYHIAEVEGVPATEIGHILPEPWNLTIDNMNAEWKFKPVVSTSLGYDKSDFYYKWEVKYAEFTDASLSKQIASTEWKTIWFFDPEKNDGGLSKNKTEISITPSKLQELFGIEIVSNGVLKAEHPAILVRCTLTSEFETHYDVSTKTTSFVRTVEDQDLVPLQASAIYSRTHKTFPILNSYAPSVHDVDQYFYYIHSCTKIIADGQKALIYDDAYNTGSWFKTVISKYNYITKNMSLNFKTTKNEKLVAVAVFDTNIIVFADNDQLGGNISVVSGNGDDLASDTYYSPYQRKVVSTNVSCDSYNSMQIVDNYVVFKYRNDIYMLDSSGLSNTDTVKVDTLNDMIRQRLGSIEMPLDRIRNLKKGEDLENDFHELRQCLLPDEIFSEVTDGCYSLIFPRQGHFTDTLSVPTETTIKPYSGNLKEHLNTYVENISMKPGLRWKCYIRSGKAYQNANKILYPWLRDVSYLFDIVSIVNIEGSPCYVRENGDIIKFDRPDGTSYTADDGYTNEDPKGDYMIEPFKLRVHTKAYDMDAPALCKFLDTLCVYYNRDFKNIAYMDIEVFNEADYQIYGPDNEAFVTVTKDTDQIRYGDNISFDEALNLTPKDKPIEQYEDHPYIDPIDKPVMILNEYKGVRNSKGEYINPALNRPAFSAKSCTPKWRFPFLSCSVLIELEGNQSFSLSALNFSYTSSDLPDYTREQLYRNIIRR